MTLVPLVATFKNAIKTDIANHFITLDISGNSLQKRFQIRI